MDTRSPGRLARRGGALALAVGAACTPPVDAPPTAPPPGWAPAPPAGAYPPPAWNAPPFAPWAAGPPAPVPPPHDPRGPAVVYALAGGAPRASPGPETPIYRPDPDGHPTEILRDDAPNRRYAALDTASCLAELGRRGVPFAVGEPTAGVSSPVRLRGPLRGVSIHSGLAPAAREHSSMEIFDCRLVVALDDFAALASARGVVEMIHLSAYRPASAHGCTPKYAGLQHCGALAVDIASFRRSDGTTWTVEKDFHGAVGSATCGPTAHPSTVTPASAGLWSLVCDAAARGIFHVILTPNHNAEHVNHFHVEVTPGADWMLIQ